MRRLDPDHPGPPYLDLADAVRAAIRDGEYTPGDRLPSRASLARHFGVSPMTVQSALRVLRDEGTIVTRQGSGAYVRETPAAPRDLAAEVDALRARVEALERQLGRGTTPFER